MDDVAPVPAAVRLRVVRPRDAASLILLRGRGRGLEVLAGRRPLHARFMPGVHVFPGGAIDPPDRIPWSVELGSQALSPRLAHSARAALRETWEEVRVLVGRVAGPHPAPPATRQIKHAYRDRHLVAALDVLTLVGRAITPSHSHRRFNTGSFSVTEPTCTANRHRAKDWMSAGIRWRGNRSNRFAM